MLGVRHESVKCGKVGIRRRAVARAQCSELQRPLEAGPREGLSSYLVTGRSGETMSYEEQYGALLEAIANEADAMAMAHFRAVGMRVARKLDGTALTEADGAIEAMARDKVAASGVALNVFGEEMGNGDSKATSKSAAPARLIIDPIDGTEKFLRGIPTFGTLLGIEREGEIVAGMASAPALGARWWAYRGEGAYRNGQKIQV